MSLDQKMGKSSNLVFGTPKAPTKALKSTDRTWVLTRLRKFFPALGEEPVYYALVQS